MAEMAAVPVTLQIGAGVPVVPAVTVEPAVPVEPAVTVEPGVPVPAVPVLSGPPTRTRPEYAPDLKG
jgi:hypothetical protein